MAGPTSLLKRLISNGIRFSYLIHTAHIGIFDRPAQGHHFYTIITLSQLLIMTTDQKQLIKATVPVLKKSGLLLTTHFYGRVFAHNPELKNVFNQENQQNGRQPMALASAVLAYAEHIDDPSVLGAALTRISHKHTSLAIRPEHYPVVGQHLLASIGEVLGDAATPDLIEAWGAAYEQLADLMIGIEAGMYATQVSKPGGWEGWRPFTVRTKVAESDGSVSFQLYPVDGGPVADHGSGQYLSIRVFVPQLNLFQPCQYRPTNAPNGVYYQISVKRDRNDVVNPNGQISNWLFDGVQPGDQLDMSAPAGVCPATVKPEKPVESTTGGGSPMHQTA